MRFAINTAILSKAPLLVWQLALFTQDHEISAPKITAFLWDRCTINLINKPFNHKQWWSFLYFAKDQTRSPLWSHDLSKKITPYPLIFQQDHALSSDLLERSLAIFCSIRKITDYILIFWKGSGPLPRAFNGSTRYPVILYQDRFKYGLSEDHRWALMILA